MTVIVKEIRSRPVYFIGGFGKPGVMQLTRDLTLLQAISINGGVLRQQIAGINTTSAEITPAATALLPTGATFGLAWANQMSDTAGIVTRSSTAELTLSQPLLRGGDRKGGSASGTTCRFMPGTATSTPPSIILWRSTIRSAT